MFIVRVFLQYIRCTCESLFFFHNFCLFWVMFFEFMNSLNLVIILLWDAFLQIFFFYFRNFRNFLHARAILLFINFLNFDVIIILKRWLSKIHLHKKIFRISNWEYDFPTRWKLVWCIKFFFFNQILRSSWSYTW